MTAIVQAYEEKEKKIHLEEIQIQTPEQEAALETLK
jgi:Spy/CpxP family protein refolding chaperone